MRAALKSIADGFGGLVSELKGFGARLDGVERDVRERPRGERDHSDGDDSDGTSVSSEGSVYLPYTEDNEHYVAQKQLHKNPTAPTKQQLYGYEPNDALAAGKRGKPKAGSLQSVLVYGESIAAPMWQVDKALVDLQSEAEDAGDDELASILEPIIATHRGAYELVNEQRALVVQRARAMASGEEYDKAELEFIENSFATRDDPAGDVPAELARLRRRFAHESRKADLRYRASKGRSSAGGGDSREDRRGESHGDRRGANGDKRTRRGTRGGKKQREREEERRGGGERRDGSRRDGGGGGGDRPRNKDKGSSSSRKDAERGRQAKPKSRSSQQRSDSSDDEGDWEVVRGRHSRRDGGRDRGGGGKGKGKAQGRRGGDRRRNGSSSESDSD